MAAWTMGDSGFSSSDLDGGSAAAVMRLLDSADDAITKSRQDVRSLDGIMFYDEWQGHQFTAEQLGQQSLRSRQQECEEIMADPAVMLVKARIATTLATINAIRELVGVGPRTDNSLGTVIKEINYADALGLEDHEYEQLRDLVAQAVQDGDLAKQDAITATLLPKLAEAVRYLEEEKPDFEAAIQRARRLAPELPA